MQKKEFSIQGTIFNIQKFSLNDGPGIRTVVFFKGCPLRCRWCSNPESQYPLPQLLYDRNKCLSCHHCYSICQEKAIMIEEDLIRIDYRRCNACGLCVNECPGKALEIKGKKMSVKEVIDIVKEDEVFYEEGNGGMTLSGGEFFAQAEFAKALLIAAKEENIHTCCETSAFVKEEIFRDIAPLFDLMIIDVKHYDETRHKEKTGISNRLPHDNLKWAIRQGINVLPRIPVIPDFNSSLSDAEAFIPYLKEMGVTKIQLLPFHQFGENKYRLLNYSYEYENKENLHKEDLREYVEILKKGVLDAFL